MTFSLYFFLNVITKDCNSQQQLGEIEKHFNTLYWKSTQKLKINNKNKPKQLFVKLLKLHNQELHFLSSSYTSFAALHFPPSPVFFLTLCYMSSFSIFSLYYSFALQLYPQSTATHSHLAQSLTRSLTRSISLSITYTRYCLH